MSLPNPLKLIGLIGSPYTRKMLALLRYRRIPHNMIWADASAKLNELGITKPKIPFLPTFIFDDENGAPVAVTDSTPIVHRLEKEVSNRSVIPNDPALAFINFLLEDYGDEWCTKYMFHYRWHFKNDADNAGTLLPYGVNLNLPDSTQQFFKASFSKRQIERLKYVGSNDTTAPIIEDSYRRLLSILEEHFKHSPFLLGRRPGSGDFAIYGQFTQLVGFDPTSRAICHELSPRTVAWVGLMEDQGGLEVKDEDWQAIEQLPASSKALLTEIGRTYVPALLANAKALMAGEQQWETEIDGVQWSQQSFPYQGKCLRWINEEFQALSSNDQDRVQTLLADTGCEALLAS